MPLILADLKQLMKILGPDGTAAGLKASYISDDDLRKLATRMRLASETSESRETIIDTLVDHLRSRELKPTDELMKMTYDELVHYFAEVAPSSDDLMKVMRELNYRVSAEDKKNLRRFVARQISETALFSNVAGRGESNKNGV